MKVVKEDPDSHAEYGDVPGANCDDQHWLFIDLDPDIMSYRLYEPVREGTDPNGFLFETTDPKKILKYFKEVYPTYDN